MSSQYRSLYDLLRSCSDQEKNNESVILSHDLSEKTDVLDKLGIQYDEEKEGVRIDLSSQHVQIYKNKQLALKFIEGETLLNKDVLILEPSRCGDKHVETVYFKDNPEASTSSLFDNIIFFEKIKQLLIKEKVCSYHDEVKEVLIFLSPKQGRIDITCNAIWDPEFYEQDHGLKRHFEDIKRKIEAEEFKNIFRESYVEAAIDVRESDKRFTETLTRLNYILESADRNYSLYQQKFSFAEFENKLYKEKEKFISKHQSGLHEFLSHTGYMPIQFGAYIYLINRFSEDAAMLAGVAAFILAWSMFSCTTIYRLLDNMKEWKNHSEGLVSKIQSCSGLPEKEFEETRKVIREKISKSTWLLRSYLATIMILSLVMISFCISQIDITCLISRICSGHF